MVNVHFLDGITILTVQVCEGKALNVLAQVPMNKIAVRTYGQMTKYPMCAVAPVSLRLVGGLTHNQGRLEVFYGGVWGTVCDDRFYSRSAVVACKHLGYTGGTYRRNKGSGFGAGIGPVCMDNVRCKGTESMLTRCHFPGWGVSDCSHNEDIGLVCTGTGNYNLACYASITEDDFDLYTDLIGVRLVDGETDQNGRVEIYYSSRWGSVCDTKWNLLNSQVVCHQLGFTRASGFRLAASFGRGSGHVWMNNVQCQGDEARLQDCKFDGWGEIGTCLHTQDVGVICEQTGQHRITKGEYRQHTPNCSIVIEI